MLRWLDAPQEAGKRSCIGEMLTTMEELTANGPDNAASQAEINDHSRAHTSRRSRGRAISERRAAASNEVTLQGAIEEASAVRTQDAQDALTAANAQIETVSRKRGDGSTHAARERAGP